MHAILLAWALILEGLATVMGMFIRIMHRQWFITHHLFIITSLCALIIIRQQCHFAISTVADIVTMAHVIIMQDMAGVMAIVVTAMVTVVEIAAETVVEMAAVIASNQA
jgi:hypothetical protein